MKTLFAILLVTVLAAACSSTTQTQQSVEMTSLVESKNYVFQAQTAQPLGGRAIQLTSEYDLRVLGDSVVAFLPYFGRAFSAPADLAGGGINFTSTNFGYTTTQRRRGGWIISIKPQDANDVRELTLSISSSGMSTLQVISNNRQSISFNGQIVSQKL